MFKDLYDNAINSNSLDVFIQQNHNLISDFSYNDVFYQRTKFDDFERFVLHYSMVYHFSIGR